MIDLNPNYLATVERILAEHVPGCEVRAFGSRASWTAKDYSDLDLAVVGDGPLDWRTLGLLKEAFEDSDLPMRVDVLDWHDIPESFQRAIERGYVVLHNDAERMTPSEWQEVTLGALCDFRAGSVFKMEYQGENEGDYPFIKVSDMNIPGNRLEINEANNWVNQSVASALGAKPFPVGTVVFAKIGEALKHNRLRITTQPTIIDNNMMGAIPKAGKVDSRFLLYAMSKFDFGQISSGTALPYLTVHSLAQLQIPLPPLPTQRAIAHVLGTLDDKIELNRRMNETLEEMARALFRSWFVDFDPVRAKMAGDDPALPPDVASLFPDRLVDSELGPIPEGWEVKPLGEVVEVVGGTTPSTKVAEYWEGEYHWATPKDLSSLSTPVLLDTERKITDAGLRQIGSGLLPAGTLLLSSRAPIGYLAVAEIPVAVNQGFIAMPPRERPSNLFMLHWCRVFHEEIVNHANGSTFLEISKSNFRQIQLVLPEAQVLREFDRHVELLHQQIVHNERESRALAAERDALLPRLVSGEVRVGEA